MNLKGDDLSFHPIVQKNLITSPEDFQSKSIDISVRPMLSYSKRMCRDIHPFGDIDLFLPVHEKDIAFLPLLFQSIELFFPCYGDLVLLIEKGQEASVLPVAPSDSLLYIVESPLPKEYGYLFQQYLKFYADLYTTRNYVLILEADSIFTKPVYHSCFFTDNNLIV